MSDLVDRLPELLEATGSDLETAGAVHASALLTGEGGTGKSKEPPPSAYESACKVFRAVALRQ